MSDRPTPKTDEKASVGLENADQECVPADFARKLERERDEARELLASEKITRNHIIKRSVEVEKERDEARKDSEYYKERYEQLKDERDEAREALREIEATRALEEKT